MEIKITEKHLEVPEKLKAIIRRKLEKLLKFYTKIEKINVIISKQKFRYEIEVILKANRLSVEAQSVNDELQDCLDDVIAKVEKRMRRIKEKLIDKKHIKKQHFTDEEEIDEDDEDEEVV
jgi:ribosome hibernation promoting factor